MNDPQEPVFKTVVKGVQFRGGEALVYVSQLAPGDELFIELEDDNEHDPNAIKAMAANKTFHIGYIEKEMCLYIRMYLEEDGPLRCIVDHVEHKPKTSYVHLNLFPADGE